MTRRSPLLATVAALTIGVAPFLAAAALAGPPAPQDPADGFRQAVAWNFAVLQYVNTRGELVEVPASRINRIALLRTADDRLRLEILFENKDYSLFVADEFHILRSAPNMTAVDVPVVRDDFAAMAFPAFR